MNFTKPDSLFNFGMKVSCYSEKMAQGTDEEGTNGKGWYRGGERISYYGNGIKKDAGYATCSYYTLSFSYKFLHDDDAVYFAFCYPYTYSDLMQDLNEIELDTGRRETMQRKVLCKTLSGQDCEVLTITQKGDLKKVEKKKAIVISSRVHPGETVGSWMMRGVLFFLTDPDNEEAKMLRERFVFKIIPMLNPDGVINGNYRCSLAGCDLNRRWKAPH
jgi:murein tripeptide amidase MpaA